VRLWVGRVPVSLVAGPVWRAVNPLRAAHRLVCAALRVPLTGWRPAPARLGYWPAAAGLAALVWLELVPGWHDKPPVVGGFALLYALAVTGAAVVYGEDFFARGDGFEVYSTLVGALAPARGNPLRALVAVSPEPGLVAVLAVWWGSTVYDGLHDIPWWRHTRLVLAEATGWPDTAVATAALAALIVVVAVGYRLTTGPHAAALATTLVPIAVGYTVAHYSDLILTEGPRGLGQLVAPGTEGPTPGLPAPAVIAVIAVTAVLVGHVLGVVAAHDRVLALAEASPALDGPVAGRAAALAVGQRHVAEQLPLVLLMIVYTMIGLYLLVLA
jgi:hypothetical protein